ncbi:glycosyltransferase [Flavobacteriaceae bacterium]|nr:glycosyltransferase [Flavobacteriaceae bacterium]
MQTPLISILVPFKNTDHYLADCLESILQQSYTQWELLIVDDGSTDSSREIVQKYADKEVRIHLFSNAGNGIIEALRTAYKHAKGTLITRMDSDDLMAIHKLEIMQKQLCLHGEGHMALGAVRYFSAKGIGDGYKRYETWLNSLTSKGTNFDEIYKECVIPSPCWMVYKSDFEDCGGFTPDTYPEDYDLAFRFYKHGLKCIPTTKVLHHWRDYDIRTSRIDAHYAENSFLELKVSYFLELSHDPEKRLVVWGAGKKGKKVAQLLITNKVAFDWVCDNPNKIGKDIYNQTLKSFDRLSEIKNPQCILTVANQEAQQGITQYLQTHKMIAMRDYFFFC